MKHALNLSQSAYEALIDYFTRHENEAVQIEILPPAFQPPDAYFLEDGPNIGIPKAILIQAYIHARAQLFKGIQEDPVNSRTAYEASRIVLLFDPEHITAANFRKRRLLATQVVADENECRQAVKREQLFLDSILTSPLHRQSKSPTLWHHRNWLLNLLLPFPFTGALEEHLVDFVRSELDAVCKAGERHPKNYYAWQYARKLFIRFEMISYTGSGQNTNRGTIEAFEHSCALHIKTWCCKNPSDISGWSFLAFLLPKLTSISQRQEITEQVLQYAVSLQWSRDALFVFLRTAIGTTMLEKSQSTVFMKLKNSLTERPSWHPQHGEDDEFGRRVKQTLEWIEHYGTLNP